MRMLIQVLRVPHAPWAFALLKVIEMLSDLRVAELMEDPFPLGTLNANDNITVTEVTAASTVDLAIIATRGEVKLLL